MNREPKFRAWNAPSQEMIYSDDFDTLSAFFHEITPLSKDSALMQFIGLFDINKKEIYVGDIVQRGIITFSRGKFVGQYYGSNGNLYEEWEDDLYQENNIEVRGNIYENPELLKDE